MKGNEQTITLKNGEVCQLRTPVGADAERMNEYLMDLAESTDYMIRYPEEYDDDIQTQRANLERNVQKERAAFIACFAGEEIVGNIGLYPVGDRLKLKHRCEIGLGVRKSYRGLGIGSALLEQAVLLAKRLGYEQMELDVVSENVAAVALYEKFGFQKTGVIPNGIKRREGGYYSMDFMVKSLLP